MAEIEPPVGVMYPSLNLWEAHHDRPSRYTSYSTEVSLSGLGIFSTVCRDRLSLVGRC